MRSQLRVYLGAAPGVGKTYALLDEVRRRTGRGARAMVVGVQTHRRPATEALRSTALEWSGDGTPSAAELVAMGLDLVAVDELERPAHLALVEELREAGVPVVTTLDVSGIASLADVVERVTGRSPIGTVADGFLADAAIELVDITPEALRRRLAHGNVFPAGELDAVTANVFRTENLAVLRELALRWVADHALGTSGTGGERVAVAITGKPGGEVIRRAARIASRTHASLVGIHVRTSSTRADDLEEARRVVEELGGEYREVAGADVAATLVAAARAERATQLVLGTSRRSRWSELWRGWVVADVLSHAGGDLDVHVIGSTLGAPQEGRRVTREVLPRRRRALGWTIVVVGLPVLTAVLVHAAADLPSALLFYILLVTAGAAVGGAWPALGSALGAFLAVNWYFIPPVHHWRIDRGADALTLLTFAVVAAVVAGLVSHAARRQADSARARAEARMLARMSGLSAEADDPLAALLRQLRDSFDLTGAAILRTGDGHVEAHVGELPATPDVTIPLGVHHRLVVAGRALSPDDRGILAVVADHLTSALRTRTLREEASHAAALAEANALRTAILTAVSHDLRTPLSSIKASVSSLRQDDVQWSPHEVASFLATIEEETDRLDDLVGNLLDLSRLQTNTLQMLERVVGLEEVVPAAIASLGDRGTSVVLDVPETLPRVTVDPGLLERALANLVANAVAWSPPGAVVRVDASRVGHRVDVRVVDRGPGIPSDDRERVFQPFQRLGDRSRDGVGLGLAVARGFVTAMRGELVVEDTPGGGTTMVASFPIAEGELDG